MTSLYSEYRMSSSAISRFVASSSGYVVVGIANSTCPAA
jgi:hypothetical protein